MQAASDSMWSDIHEKTFGKKDGRKEFIKHYRTLKLDTAALNQVLTREAGDSSSIRDTRSIISLPLPDGSFARFRFTYSSAMSSGSKNKNIRTYMGQGVDDVYLGECL